MTLTQSVPFDYSIERKGREREREREREKEREKASDRRSQDDITREKKKGTFLLTPAGITF